MDQLIQERAALEAALSRHGVQCTDIVAEALLKHLHLLIDKNKTLNLTRIDSVDKAIVLHIEDSLAVLPEFELRQGRFCDIGTGGGFPGLPLGIVTGRYGVLLDSVKKKAGAVQGFIEELHLSDTLQSVGMRSEEYALECGGSFDTVVARAVSSLNVVEELASPLLSSHGLLVAMRGTEDRQQLDEAMGAAEKLGLELIFRREFTIGVASEEYVRSVYVFEKIGDPSVKVPRRPGMAVKRPLK